MVKIKIKTLPQLSTETRIDTTFGFKKRTASLLIAIFALIAGGGITLAAPLENPHPTYPAETVCATPLAKYAPRSDGKDWSAQEIWAWDKRICLGKIAVLSERSIGMPGRCNFSNEEDWPDDRVLNSEFVQTVMFYEPFRSSYTQNGLRIMCAYFPKELDLSNGHFRHELWFNNSYFAKGLRANYLRIDKSFSLNGSHFRGKVNALHIRVGGDLLLQSGAEFQEVRLLGAKIGGLLITAGSHFKGDFIADDLSVGGDLYMQEAEFQKIRLHGAKIDGQLYAEGSRFLGLFAADRLSVGGDLLIGAGAEFNEVRLRGATVRGQLSARGSRFRRTFAANRLNVEGDLNLSDGAEFQEVYLVGATIRGQLSASGSNFKKSFIAENLSVGNDLLLDGAAEFQDVRLAGAKIGGLLTTSRLSGLMVIL